MNRFLTILLLLPLFLMGCTGGNKTSSNQTQEEVADEDMPRLMLVNSTDTKGNTGFAGFMLSSQDGKEVYLYDDEANYDDSVYPVYLALMLGQTLYQWAYYENNTLFKKIVHLRGKRLLSDFKLLNLLVQKAVILRL